MAAATIHSRSHARSLSDRSILNVFGGVLTFLIEAVERQRTRRDLASLDDRMLRDIGLSRYDVEMELRRPWWKA
jgi:uncharacterized protein YjiS (DUF1127 family)